MNKAENHEVVSIYTLDDDVREAMLLEQKECVLNWCTQDEWPMGVIHSYISVSYTHLRAHATDS